MSSVRGFRCAVGADDGNPVFFVGYADAQTDSLPTITRSILDGLMCCTFIDGWFASLICVRCVCVFYKALGLCGINQRIFMIFQKFFNMNTNVQTCLDWNFENVLWF